MNLLQNFYHFDRSWSHAGSCFVYEYDRKSTEQSKERIASIKSSMIESPSRAFDLLVAKRNLKSMSTEELILIAELSLELPDSSFNHQALKELKNRLPKSIEVRTFDACVMVLKGEIREGINQLEKISKENPSDPMSRYFYLKNKWVLGGIDDRIIAKNGLFQLGESNDRWGYKSLQALNFTSRSDGLLVSDSLTAIEKLQNHPLVTSLDYINSNERKVGLIKDYTAEDALAESKKELGRLVNPVDLGFWSLSMGFTKDALDIVPPTLVKSEKEAFWVRFNGLLRAMPSEAGLLFKDFGDDLSPQEKLGRRYTFLLRKVADRF